MTAFLSLNDMSFPSPDQADEQGIIAIGGDFSPARLLSAYRSGIFPWPHPGLPILWFCPDPRFVLEPTQIIISSSLAKRMRQTKLSVAADRNFATVMRRCQASYRKDQAGTWITDEMISGYCELFKQGYAHSIEAYNGDKLVGGLYGLALGSIFFGESMFFEATDASKISFVTLVAHLIEWNFSLIDCQAHTAHLEKFGATFLARAAFLDRLDDALRRPLKPGAWHLHLSPAQALKVVGG